MLSIQTTEQKEILPLPLAAYGYRGTKVRLAILKRRVSAQSVRTHKHAHKAERKRDKEKEKVHIRAERNKTERETH